MAISTLEALSERTQRFRYAWSPRLLFSELLLKQWFEPVIPFTVMIALAPGLSLEAQARLWLQGRAWSPAGRFKV